MQNIKAFILLSDLPMLTNPQHIYNKTEHVACETTLLDCNGILTSTIKLVIR